MKRSHGGGVAAWIVGGFGLLFLIGVGDLLLQGKSIANVLWLVLLVLLAFL